MKIYKLNQFGSTLTGREFGKTSYKQMSEENPTLPVVLDFGGVASLGSSYADEVVPYFAHQQANKITILNANDVVRSCLRDVRDETGIKITLGTLGENNSIIEGGDL
jgi:hypothetical protein